MKRNNTQLDKNKITQLLETNQKLAAIKYVRQLTGMGLKDAKEFVEAMEKDPSKFDLISLDDLEVEKSIHTELPAKNKKLFLKGSSSTLQLIVLSLLLLSLAIWGYLFITK